VHHAAVLADAFGQRLEVLDDAPRDAGDVALLREAPGDRAPPVASPAPTISAALVNRRRSVCISSASSSSFCTAMEAPGRCRVAPAVA
jgi:hypothetical protein